MKWFVPVVGIACVAGLLSVFAGCTDPGDRSSDASAADQSLPIPTDVGPDLSSDGIDGHTEIDQDRATDLLPNGDCESPTPFWLDGSCVECLEDSHCESMGKCNIKTHECRLSCDLECCYCQEPYESCTQSSGVWLCVECTQDSDCGVGQACDPVRHACLGQPPAQPMCAGCLGDQECWDPVNPLDLACDVASGCCYDRLGRCDNIGGMCLGEAGTECIALQAVSTGALPGSVQAAACSCNQTWDGDTATLEACLPDGCPDDGCLGRTICVDAQTAAKAGLPLQFEGGLCLSLSLFEAEEP